jgi:uncharacterized membrane protein YfcA
MTPLDQIDAYLGGPALLCALVGLGLAVGVLTGLFGVGGAFLMNPLMIIVLGMDQSLVVGSSLCFTIGTAASGLSRHMRLKNVEAKTFLILAGGASCGAVLGSQLHEYVRAVQRPGDFRLTILCLYLAMLLCTAWLVVRGPSKRHDGRSLLQRLRLPPRIELPSAGLHGVSLPGLVLAGLLIGVVTGLLGIGGGVLLMPIMLVVIGLTAHQAVGTSLGVVLFGSIAGMVEHAMAGNVSLWIAMPPLVGSTLGVQIGAWICARLHARRLRNYFAVIVLLAAVLVAADIVKRITES